MKIFKQLTQEKLEIQNSTITIEKFSNSNF